MKKIRIFSVLLLCLTLTLSVAFANEAVFSKLEMEEFFKTVAQKAQTEKAVSVEKVQDHYQHAFNEYTLETDGETITDDTVMHAMIVDDVSVFDNVADHRHMFLSASVQTLLNAYPNNNRSLFGTDEHAVLYIDGKLPADVSVGFITRNGQQIQTVEHRVYYVQNDAVHYKKAVYTINNDAIISIDLYNTNSTLTTQQAQEEIDIFHEIFNAMDASTIVVGHNAESALAFGRDDLIFSGIDFLDLTPQGAVDIFGDDYTEEYIEDENTYILVMEWEAATITFLLNKDKEVLYIDNIYVDSPTIEGPRGVRVGAQQEWNLSRFLYEPAQMKDNAIYIYGSPQEEAYAVTESVSASHSTFRYVYTQDDKLITLLLEMQDATLINFLVFTQ